MFGCSCRFSPTPGPIDLHRDAVLGEMRAGADAASHQHHRALQRTGRDDDLTRLDGEALAVAAGEARRRDAAAFDHQPVERRLGQHREVGPLAHLGRQIHQRRAAAPAVRIDVERGGEYAVGPGTVLVLVHRVAHVGEDLRHGARVAGPVLLAMALDRHRAGLAVQRLAVVGVGLQLLEVGQHVRPAPAMRADRCPFVVVVR